MGEVTRKIKSRLGMMIKTLSLFFATVMLTQAVSLEINIAYQKTTHLGHPYGGPGGIYFEIKDIEPLIPYWVQYSYDLKVWHDLYNFGNFGTNTTSPIFHWYELPPDKCFFRIIEKF
jgi:hypothetical protein